MFVFPYAVEPALITECIYNLSFTCLIKECSFYMVHAVASRYANMEDSMLELMIHSGIPLEEPHLLSRLNFIAKQEMKGFREGKLPIEECYNLMGSTDPTGTLKPNEVCVIL